MGLPFSSRHLNLWAVQVGGHRRCLLSSLPAPAVAAAASASYCPRGGGDAVTASGCGCGGDVAAGGPGGAPCKLEFGGSVAEEGEIVPAAQAPIDGLGNARMISRFGCRIRGVGVPACRPAEKLKLTQRPLLISVWTLEIVVAGMLLVQMPRKTAMQEKQHPQVVLEDREPLLAVVAVHDTNHPGGIERRLREASRVGPPGEEALVVELLPLARDHAAHVLVCLVGSEPRQLVELEVCKSKLLHCSAPGGQGLQVAEVVPGLALHQADMSSDVLAVSQAEIAIIICESSKNLICTGNNHNLF
uniref:Uncharacterized protein n=1 Tax=Oryza punctata TaxID=4537 RepID=A0A0E0LE36_ORYPU